MLRLSFFHTGLRAANALLADPCLNILICSSSFADYTAKVDVLNGVIIDAMVTASVCVAFMYRLFVLLTLLFSPIDMATMARFSGFLFILYVLVEQYEQLSPSLQVLT